MSRDEEVTVRIDTLNDTGKNILLIYKGKVTIIVNGRLNKTEQTDFHYHCGDLSSNFFVEPVRANDCGH